MFDDDTPSPDPTAALLVLIIISFVCGIGGLAIASSAATVIAVPVGIVSLIAILLGTALANSILWAR